MPLNVEDSLFAIFEVEWLKNLFFSFNSFILLINFVYLKYKAKSALVLVVPSAGEIASGVESIRFSSSFFFQFWKARKTCSFKTLLRWEEKKNC